jgi:hypothetical protein
VSRSEGRGVGSRQAVTQHLEVLEDANLFTTSQAWGRSCTTSIPVPLYEIYEPWIAKFARSRLKALREMKKRLAGGNR